MTGIIFLIVATVFAAMFSVLFKIFHIKGIDSNQAIFFNYLSAFVFGLIFSFNGGMAVNPIKSFWFVPVLCIGLVFVLGMVMLSESTKRVGVAISTVCSRASMIIPILVSYIMIEGSDKPKWLPICLIIIAMTLTVWTNTSSGGPRMSFRDVIAPISVFIMFGLSNSMIKVVQHKISATRIGVPEHEVNSEISLVTAMIFLTAMLLSSYSFFLKDKSGNRSELKLKNVLGGVALGTVNYFCTYLLMLSMKSIDSSILFPLHNIGIVAIGTLVGVMAFHEKMRLHQVIGIIIAAGAIAWLCI